MKKLVLVLSMFTIAYTSYAAEPSYCDPAQFKNHEVRYNGNKPSNLHVYKIGNLTLAGMAIGHSNMQDMTDMAQSLSPAGAPEKYCTWYLNDGNAEAQKAFVWNYVPRPTGSDYKKTGDIYMTALGDDFDQNAISFVSCAVNAGYIAMGCDGMKHRGPSVFAMLLSYAGCTPEHSAAIATQIWGSNGISIEMRTALGQRAAAVAAAHPQLASQLRAVMLQ